MEKKIFLGFIFILMIGLVFAADEWGDISGGNNLTSDSAGESVSADTGASDVSPVQDEPVDVGIDNQGSGQDPLQSDTTQFSKGGTYYTRDFYIALGLGFFALFLVLIFLYFFIRGPRNRWKRKRVN